MTSALRGSRLAPPAAVLVVLLLAATAGGVRSGSGGNAAAGSRKLVAGGSGNNAALAELVKDTPHASAEGETLVVKDSAPSSASGNAAEAEAQIPALQLIIAEEGRAEGAVCLDGSSLGFYYRKEYGSERNNWVLYFESCARRAGSRLGSTDLWPSAAEMEAARSDNKNGSMNGMLSANRSVNPDFYNWNAIYFIYCDGGSFSGDVDAPVHFNVSCLSACPPLCLSASLPLCLSASPSLLLSASPPLRLSFSPSLRLSPSPPLCLSTSPPLRLCACMLLLPLPTPQPLRLSTCLPLCLSSSPSPILSFSLPLLLSFSPSLLLSSPSLLLSFSPSLRLSFSPPHCRSVFSPLCCFSLLIFPSLRFISPPRGVMPYMRERISCPLPSLPSPEGRRIADVLLKRLLNKMGLDHADTVLVSGCSAGAVALLVHCDGIKDTLKALSPSVGVRCLADSSMFLNVADINNTNKVESFFIEVKDMHVSATCTLMPSRTLPASPCLSSPLLASPHPSSPLPASPRLSSPLPDHNLTDSLPAACIAEREPERHHECFMPRQLLQFVSTPLFLINSNYDKVVLMAIGAPQVLDTGYRHHPNCFNNLTECTPAEKEVVENYRKKLATAVAPLLQTSAQPCALQMGCCQPLDAP
ncbi:unnamed protein product [Closterium sp. NIES-65]|nr:unnamed protein product [Closterium sp. NIES-65]